ncbi:hypothetical protein ACWGII_18705 [Streptomyces sp. NPDC054855]
MHRATVALLATCLLLAGAAVGCSKSYDETARDCVTALTERTEGEPADTPTVNEANERNDTLYNTLADMVRMGHADLAKDAADALEEKPRSGGESKQHDAVWQGRCGTLTRRGCRRAV